MKLLNRIIDWLQATFTPNRVVVMLGGVLTGLSATISAWLAAHVPGVHLTSGEITAVALSAAAISVRLLDRWIDGWQAQEPIDFGGDLENAADEFVHDPAVQHAGGAIVGLKALEGQISQLAERVEGGGAQPAEIVSELDAVGHTLARFLSQQPAQPNPSPQGTE